MKKIRCPYFELNDLERTYHDKEWGTPCRNDRKLFEYLMYEVLQCGLSWDTIIQKRAAFRVAFERFDFEKIARYCFRYKELSRFAHRNTGCVYGGRK